MVVAITGATGLMQAHLQVATMATIITITT